MLLNQNFCTQYENTKERISSQRPEENKPEEWVETLWSTGTKFITRKNKF